MPETPEETVARLSSRPLESLSRAERSALNSARNAVREATRAGKRAGGEGESPPASAGPDLACARTESPPQELASPEGIRKAFERAMQGVWRIVTAPPGDRSVTNRDRLEAASFLRHAAGIGKEPPAPDTFALQMDDFLNTPGAAKRDEPRRDEPGERGE